MSPSARRLGILLVVVWIIFGVGGLVWFFNRPQYTERQENERAVYRTILTDSRYWGKSVMVEETTNGYFEPRPVADLPGTLPDPETTPNSSSRFDYYVEAYPALQQATLEDAERINASTQPFPTDLWLYFLVRYDTVNSEVLAQQQREIDRYVSFSQIGFNPDYTQAMVYVYFECGWFCGGGDIYFLEQIEGEWKVVTTKTVLYI